MNKQAIIIVIFLIVLAAAVVAWVVFYKGKQIQTQTQANPSGASGQTSGIGGEIFQKVQNPVAGKLPESSVGGNVNPLDGAYKNPFGQ